MVRPDPIPNSAVKRSVADGSGFIDSARVGSRHSLLKKPKLSFRLFSLEAATEKPRISLVLLNWANRYMGVFSGYLARPLSRATRENIFAFANKYGSVSSCLTVGVSR